MTLSTYGPNGLAATYFTGSGILAPYGIYYGFDPAGNVAVAVKVAGSTQATTYLSDAFGKGGATAGAGFAGQWGGYTDTETGLVLLGHRYYDPNTGRFLTRDPIGYLGGINLYAYCKNNPVNWVDPLGLCGKQAGDEEWDYAMEMDRFRRDIPRLYAQTLLDQDKQMVLNTLPGVLGLLGEANAALSPMRAIKATQPIAPRTAKIPQSFVLELESGNIWVHPNAVKHLLELVGHASQKPLAEQLLLDDLVNAVRIATGQGIPYGKRIVIEGMELIFSKPREAGLLPVLKHARRIF